MDDNKLIIVSEIEINHSLDQGFMENLEAYELIEFVIKDTKRYVYSNQLPLIERIIRLHYDLEINMEGIEVINHMLIRMESLHETIRKLENKLTIYD